MYRLDQPNTFLAYSAAVAAAVEGLAAAMHKADEAVERRLE